MGGKGGGGDSGAMYTPPATETPKVLTTEAAPSVAKPTPKKDPPITEDPTKGGSDQTKAPDETQPYAPPGFGNYSSSNTNLSPLGDALVAGAFEQPGKPGPTTPKYIGQV